LIEPPMDRLLFILPFGLRLSMYGTDTLEAHLGVALGHESIGNSTTLDSP
jgi:hypothetical protein